MISINTQYSEENGIETVNRGGILAEVKGWGAWEGGIFQ